jgi:hypothetical protein
MPNNGRLKRQVLKRMCPRPEHIQAAVSNGTSLLVHVDGRSVWMRRLRDLTRAHINQLGGEGNISHAENVLIRRTAMLTLQCEIMDKRFAENNGEAPAWMLELYCRTSNSLRRLLDSLGLQRRARNVTPPTLEQYLQHTEDADGGAGGGGHESVSHLHAVQIHAVQHALQSHPLQSLAASACRPRPPRSPTIGCWPTC